MAKAQSAYQYESPRCPDNWNEAERRFYARVIEIFDDIYIKYGKVDKTTVKSIEKTLTGSSVDNFEGNSLSVGVANIVKLVCEKAVIDVLSAGQIAAYSFEATFGHLVSLSAKLASFDFETVKNLVSSALVVENAVGTNVRIKNLVVDYAQMTAATIENLCIRAENGKYYVLSVDPEGKVTATETEVDEFEKENGVTKNNNVILETDIIATNLTTSNLYASVLLANEITAYRIDVDTLTAREAFIQSLTSQQAFIKWLQTEQIAGGKSLTMLAGEAAQAQVDAEFATPIDSEEPPEIAPAAGKLWIDRGTTPHIFRRWKGLEDIPNTDRDYTVVSSNGNGAYFENRGSRIQHVDELKANFVAGLSGTPTPDNPVSLQGFTYANLQHIINGETRMIGQVTFAGSVSSPSDIAYGVEVDWLHGIWKQTHWTYVLTGNENINWISFAGGRFDITFSSMKRAASFVPICTHFKGSSGPYYGANEDCTVCVNAAMTNGAGVYIMYDKYTSADDMRQWLKDQYDNGTPVKIVFELAEPIEYRFTPVTLDMSPVQSYLYCGRTPSDSPDSVLTVTTTCSGWDTLNSAEDIRAAQTEIQTQQQNAQAAIDELRTAVVTDNEGVHVRKVDNDDVQLIRNEVLITQNDVSIVSNGKRNSTFGSGYIRLMDMVIRAASNGIVIEAAEV